MRFRSFVLLALVVCGVLASACRDRLTSLPPPDSSETVEAPEVEDCQARAQSPKYSPLSYREVLLCLNSTLDIEPAAIAEELVQQGIDLATSPLEQAYVEHYAALLAQNRGEFEQALFLGRASGKVFEREGKTQWLAASLHNQGVLLSAVGQGREALAQFEKALSLRQELGEEKGQGASLTQMGWVFFLIGNRDQAIHYLELALEKRSTPYGRAVTLDRLGSVYRDSGRHGEALDSYRQALEIFETLKDSKRGYVLANLGWLNLEVGNSSEAERQILASLPLLRQIGDRDAEAHVLVGLSRIARQRNQLEMALGYLETALRIVEQLRQETPFRSLRSTYLALREDYFSSYLDLLMALHRENPARGYHRRAFFAEEKRRSRALLDRLFLEPDESLDEINERSTLSRKLRAEITSLELALRSEKDGEERHALERRLVEQSAEYEMLRSAPLIEAVLPETDRRLADLAGTQALLDADTCVLSYSLGEKGSVLFYVTREDFAVFDLPPRHEIEEMARDFYELVISSAEPLSADQMWIVGQALGELLLSPLVGKLEERIIVLKDGALHHIPFTMLPRPGGDGRPLLEDHVVIAAPSVSILATLSRRSGGRRWRAGAAEHRITIVAPDVGGGRSPDDERFPILHSVEQEVASIRALVPEERIQLLLGTGATRDNLLDASFEPDIIHFATHAYLFRDFPELSAVLLSDGRNGSDLLRLQEIFDLSIPTDLVVLSACETALGDLLRGEGMVNMTHGFLSAGSGRVIVSLWQVDDEATAALMERFYSGLLDLQLDPALALREAQRSLYEGADGRWSAPYFWAAFELQGLWR